MTTTTTTTTGQIVPSFICLCAAVAFFVQTLSHPKAPLRKLCCFLGQKRSRSIVLLVFCLQFVLPSCAAWNATPRSFLGKTSTAGDLPNSNKMETGRTRRDFIQSLTGIVAGVMIAPSLILPTPQAIAAGEEVPEGGGLMSAANVADLLHPIPTFTIVDAKGVPFTVVGEDARVTGYFFTTYPEAARVLQLAKASSDKAISAAKAEGQDPDEVGTNPWEKARISTVPLDSAVTLVYKSFRTKGVYFKIAPAEEDVEDALAVTGEEDLSEGKVPLFYYEDFTLDRKDGTSKTPLYFRKNELEKEWRRKNPKEETPKLMVTELFSVLAEMVKPGQTDEELCNLAFVAPKESEKKQQECLKKGGKAPAFVIGQRIVVL
mmetsp:Transcript_10096/g.18081  ORF Transcript_10096/g.18081 Transcript_10096/m.18081 type:complete len:375 (+) Transcript_10096:164-1288(+)